MKVGGYMDDITIFDSTFSNAPEWKEGKTYYESDIVSYQGKRYEAIITIESSEIPPDLCADYRIIKQGRQAVE